MEEQAVSESEREASDLNHEDGEDEDYTSKSIKKKPRAKTREANTKVSLAAALELRRRRRRATHGGSGRGARLMSDSVSTSSRNTTPQKTSPTEKPTRQSTRKRPRRGISESPELESSPVLQRSSEPQQSPSTQAPLATQNSPATQDPPSLRRSLRPRPSSTPVPTLVAEPTLTQHRPKKHSLITTLYVPNLSAILAHLAVPLRLPKRKRQSTASTQAPAQPLAEVEAHNYPKGVAIHEDGTTVSVTSSFRPWDTSPVSPARPQLPSPSAAPVLLTTPSSPEPSPKTFPPYPEMPPRAHSPFHTGVQIALSNILADSAENPGLGLRDIVQELEATKPTVVVWRYMMILEGGEWVYRVVLGDEEEDSDGTAGEQDEDEEEEEKEEEEPGGKEQDREPSSDETDINGESAENDQGNDAENVIKIQTFIHNLTRWTDAEYARLSGSTGGQRVDVDVDVQVRRYV